MAEARGVESLVDPPWAQRKEESWEAKDWGWDMDEEGR